MIDTYRGRLVAYGVAVLATALSLAARWRLFPLLGQHSLFLTFLPAIMLSAYLGGRGPGLLATFLAAAAADLFLSEPRYLFGAHQPADVYCLGLFVLTGVVVSGLTESLHRSRRRVEASERCYAVTLASIGDAVIATDTRGRVTFLNPAAEALTGWPAAEAGGRPLTEVFRIVNERTRQPVEDPAARVLRLGAAVGLSNHTALRARDGRETPIDDSAAPIRDDRGALAGVVLVFRDVTQRRQAEEAEALRLAQERMELAVRGSNVGVWDVDMPDGDYLRGRRHYMNIWEQFGMDRLPEGWQGGSGQPPREDGARFAWAAAAAEPPAWETAALQLHPDDRGRMEQAISRYLAGETSEYEVEARFRHADGSYRTMLARGVAVRDAAGRPVRFVGILLDITRLKRAEEALRASEQRFRTFVDHAADAFFLHDERGVILDVNRQACESLGYTRDELVGMTPLDFDPDLTPTLVEDLVGKAGAGISVPREARHRRKDGTVFPVELRGKGFEEGGRRFFVSLVRDVTDRKRAGEALHESEQRWRSLTESLPHLVWSATPDGACDYFSTQWTDHTGVEEAGLLGWRWLATLHPEDRGRTQEFWLESVAGRHPYDVEYRVRRRDGEYRWFKTRGVPIRDGRGVIVKWFGTCTDITDLRQTQEALRESERRFRGTFENAAVGIAHTDLGGRWLRVNERLGAILGYTPDEALRLSWQDITYAEDLPASNEQFAALLRGERRCYSLDKRYVRKDGSVIWGQLVVSLQRDEAGAPAYAIGVVQDISERKRLDAELRQALRAAEGANRAKDEFLANVSHEIRTPMNAILGMTELTLQTELTQDQRQCLRTVKSAADSLLVIIDDLLDFAKIESGKMELHPADFSLRSAVGDTLRALAVRAHNKGLELVCRVQPDVPDALVGDAGRLRQVLLNLVGNAIKFTEHGEVVVSVRPGEEGGAPASAPVSVHFEVRDTGIGIPPHKQQSIFRAFEQEDSSTTRKYGGTGLGLSISYQLVGMMGGTISVDSAPGQGSTFRFTARFGRGPAQAEPAARPGLPRGLRVLVVDDNATNRRLLGDWLRGWQTEPRVLGDGPTALDALLRAAGLGEPYPLVLLDSRMPEMDGLTLAARVRGQPQLAGTRLILLTSGDRPGDWERMEELRVEAHLLKPVQKEELLETIGRVMAPRDDKVTGRQGDKATEGEPAGPVPLSSVGSLRILVAEDNEFNVQLLEMLLARRGHRVRLASTGTETLALARQGGFDLLLLDIHMPELDGFGVARAIREWERAGVGRLPIIAFTARSRAEDRRRCLEAGMDDFLSKPVQIGELWAAIDRAAAARGPTPPAGPGLLDPAVVLAACGGDDVILGKICQTLRARLPDHLSAVQEALTAADAPRLREAAHKLCGMVSAFSTLAAAVASDLEDRAAGGQVDECRPLAGRLGAMCKALAGEVDGLSVEALAGARRSTLSET
jgi:PAS domain S-box-containing protein